MQNRVGRHGRLFAHSLHKLMHRCCQYERVCDIAIEWFGRTSLSIFLVFICTSKRSMPAATIDGRRGGSTQPTHFNCFTFHQKNTATELLGQLMCDALSLEFSQFLSAESLPSHGSAASTLNRSSTPFTSTLNNSSAPSLSPPSSPPPLLIQSSHYSKFNPSKSIARRAVQEIMCSRKVACQCLHA